MAGGIGNGSSDIPQLQWFPGHMKKAQRLIEENLRLVDAAVELRDARIPSSSANPMLKKILGGKPSLIALGKSDLADPSMTRAWLSHFARRQIPAVAIDAAHGKGMKQLERLAEELARPRTDRLAAHGANPRAARIMILGIPNVGKSSLNNCLAGAARTKTEDRPGVTRAKQWIRIGKNLELLDMPGLLWPKFEDPKVALKLAFTGAIRDETYDLEQVACLLLETMAELYPERLEDRFRLRPPLPASGIELLEAVGRKRGCLLKGNAVDLDKAQRIVMTEFRGGKLGAVTLDPVPAPRQDESENKEETDGDS